jgi:DNA-binding NarL/FixJ family response regulator
MKLLIADDHALFRDALVQYFERGEAGTECALARDFNEAMGLLEIDQDFDLVMLDLRMPGMNGLKGIEVLKKEYPDIPVVLMSGMAEHQDVEAAFEMGISGYFPKTMSGKAFLNATKQVIAGEKYMPKDHNTGDILPSYYGGSKQGDTVDQDNEATPFVPKDIQLTPRETEVLSYLMRGASNKEIARALDLQVVTIKLHVRGVCRKLGAKNRTQAALMATDLGLTKSIG